MALDEVHRYEGTVTQFLGDGFMALFGAPLTHEDHADRAVRAAWGVHERLERDPILVPESEPAPLCLRMGLNTGEVIVGRVGDGLRMDYTAVGDTIKPRGAPRGDSAASDGDADSQRAKLTSALAFHGGEPYPEWPYEPWVEGLRARIHRAHLRALEALGDNLIDTGRAAEAVEPLATLVEADPGHEAAHCGLMRAYAAAGERARGLRQFHACRSSLVREQGVEPSPATRELYASLLGDA